MLAKKKSLTKRAAEAVKAGNPASDLQQLKAEVTNRLQDIEGLIRTAELNISHAENEGDIDLLLEAKKSLSLLKDEELLLLKQQHNLGDALKTARGLEAKSQEASLKKSLVTAIKKAREARSQLSQCLAVAQTAVTARQFVREVNETILYDSADIQELADLLHPYKDNARNQRDQLMIDLGIIESRRARK
jgi:ABC-type transporter Mla subunit MlaD